MTQKEEELAPRQEDGVLSISSIIKYSRADNDNTRMLMGKLDELGLEYIKLIGSPSPERLEAIKREFGGYLTSLATYYAIIRAYKQNNEYFDEERKRFKSEAIQIIVDRDKVSTASAEKTVYKEKYYIERVELIQTLKKFFIRVELKFDRYRDLARDIYQSVSAANQERRITTGD